MEGMEALSFSSLDRYGQCEFRWSAERLTITDEDEQISSPQMVRGSIIHKFMEEITNHMLEFGEWPDEQLAELLMQDLWDNGFEKDDTNIKDFVLWPEGFEQQSKEDSLKLVSQIYDELLPELDPVASEQYLTLELPKPGRDIKYLHGIVDYIGEPSTIIDWKTSTSAKQRDFSDLQSTVYTALTGMQRASVHYVQFIFLKTKDPRIEWNTVRRDEGHTNWLLNDYIPRIIERIEALEDGASPTITPGWYCKWCPVDCGIRC